MKSVQPHLDGPMYLPTIATINLGSHTVLNYYESDINNKNVRQKVFSLFLQPRSLLIQREQMYTHYLHGIDEKYEDIIDNSLVNLSAADINKMSSPVKRETRVSLTIRHVLKTTKIKIKIG